MVETVIDKEWFFDRLRDRRQSLREMARHMELDPSAVSRMLSGQRKMQMEEAGAIARFLGAPVAEVLKHAGIALDIDGHPSRVVLAATITSAGRIDRLSEARSLPQQVIDRALAALSPRGNSRVIAAQVRAQSGPMAMWDDAVVLFGYTEIVEPAAIGVLSVCRLMSGEQILAKIESARKTGEARITGLDHTPREVTLDTATPVLAVIP
jgi:transcriptional regulator with XRE-family HTH domain